MQINQALTGENQCGMHDAAELESGLTLDEGPIRYQRPRCVGQSPL
jgi:hypothetical protein